MAVESSSSYNNQTKKQQNSTTNCSSTSCSSSTTSSSSSSSSPSDQECPLCLEVLDLDDRSFYPCTCGYQICRFCWHRILSESSHESKGSCPACRKPYSENPANFKPLSVEDVQFKLKQQRKQKDQQKKQKTVDSRKHLGELRVVQKNLVFVVGITPRIADPELLKKSEYFGRFGRIHKIVVNCVGSQQQPPTITPTTTTAQPTSYGAYITYTKSDDALRAIQSVNNIPFDGKTIKASLGTTKYCSHFMRNQVCPKGDCMYLHSQGDSEASFTKEDMQQGKHQEYERKLIDEFNRQQQQQQVIKEQQQQQKQEEIVEKVEPVILQPEEEEEEPYYPVAQTPEEPPHHEEIVVEEELIKPTELLSLLDLNTTAPDTDSANIDFDPFYETQKAFESIIQQEMANWTTNAPMKLQAPPPGFGGNNQQQQWQQQQQQHQQHSVSDDWIDPAIIYCGNGQQQGQGQMQRQHQQQQNIGHLLGSSLLNDIFSNNLEQQGQGQMGQMQQQQQQQRHYHHHPLLQQQQPHHHNHYNNTTPPPPTTYPPLFSNNAAPPPKFTNNPPPGFSTQQGQQQPPPTPQQQQFINNNFFNNFPF